MYYDLETINFSNNHLSIKLSSLVEGQPDDWIGTPLVVSSESIHYTIDFLSVEDFRCSHERYFNEYLLEVELEEFLYECKLHSYFGNIVSPDNHYYQNYKYYIVYTEWSIIEIFTKNPPTIKTEHAK